MSGTVCRMWGVLAIVLVLILSGCAAVNRPIAAASPEDQLRIAQLRYDHREYTEAIQLLQQFIQYNAQSPDLDQAHFLLGMCYVQRKEWPLAVGEFLVVTSDFPDSPLLSDAHYWLGVSYWRQSRPALYDQESTRRAISQWDRFLNLYPNHPRAEEARGFRAEGRARLAEKAVRNGRLYVVLKHWKPALIYFDEVIRDYADTPWVDWGLVGRAEALIGQHQFAEARAALEEALPRLQDEDARSRAEELLEDVLEELPAGTPASPAPAADGNPG